MFHKKLTVLPLPVFAFFLGCANPGPPKPPSLRLPRPAAQLTAERVGDHVTLTWTTSAETTDGDLVRDGIVASVCRDDAPAAKPVSPIYPAPADPCHVVHTSQVRAGASAWDDPLPANLTSGAPALIAYRVTLLNNRGRSAGPSAPAYSASGAAPAPAGILAISPRRNSALITWQPSYTTPYAPMHLTRTLLATSQGPVDGKSARKASAKSSPLQRATTASEVVLVPEETGSSDPGGTLDRSIHDGDTLRYSAQRVLTVQLNVPAAEVLGKKGAVHEKKASLESIELRGDPSPGVIFSFHDTLPPSAPTGVVAVPGGGFSEPAEIDLSWAPNSEADLLGYNIYRAESDDAGSWVLLNSQPVPGLSYRDLTAQPGRSYIYRITAVDQRRNESARSAPLREQLNR